MAYRETTIQKKITYFESLIRNKKRLIEEYTNGLYHRQGKNWDQKAQSMITNWEKKIQQLEDIRDYNQKRAEEKTLLPKKKYKYLKKEYPVSVTHKVCTICKEKKTASEFSRNKNVTTGLTLYCKSCINKKYGWKSNPEVKKAYYAKYGKYASHEEMIRIKEQRAATAKQRSYERLLEYNKSWGGGVYLIETECKETYVGFSYRLRARKDQHNCKNKRPDSPIAGIYKIKKFTILEKTKDKKRETYWIHKLKPTINQRKVKK